MYPNASEAELVRAALEADVKLTASRRSVRDYPGWILYAVVAASLGGAVLLLWVLAVLDRHGIWHEKDSWRRRVADRIGRGLEDGRTT